MAFVAAVVVIAWGWVRQPSSAQSARIAAVLESTAPVDEPAAYAHCASCHLHDGSGRPDGSIPRLNGQRRTVLQSKLHRLRAGHTALPVMEPFARTLTPGEVNEVATYLESLPDTTSTPPVATEEERTRGAALFTTHCAACHGANAEGHDGLLASRLCGQYEGYLDRRLTEIAAQTRGNADAVMQGVLGAATPDDLRFITTWLAAGQGCAIP